MAAPLTPNRNPIQAELLARVAAGVAVTAVCRQADMPSHRTLLAWQRRSPEFAEALAAARARGSERRRWGFDEGRAQAVLARLRAGESVRTIVDRRGATISAPLYRRWMRTQAVFQEEVNRLIAERRGLRAAAGPAAPAWPFDRAMADRIVVAVGRGRKLADLGPGFPPAVAVAQWRREDADFDTGLTIAQRVGRRAAAARAGPEPRLRARILAAARKGESLHAISRRPGMPSSATLYRWRAANRGFAQALADARDAWLDAMSDRLMALSETDAKALAHRAEIRALIRRLNRLEAALGNPGT